MWNTGIGTLLTILRMAILAVYGPAPGMVPHGLCIIAEQCIAVSHRHNLTRKAPRGNYGSCISRFDDPWSTFACYFDSNEAIEW